MKINKSKTQRQRHMYLVLLTLMCISIIFSGCTKAESESPQSNTSTETPSTSESNTNGTTSESAPQQTSPNSDTSDTKVSNKDGIPAGVKIEKVLKDESIKNDYHKKVELLTDGGELKTITDPNGNISRKYIEYEGIILKANGNTVDVQVEHGGKQTITIPKDVTIEDKDKVGLKQGIEIEWEVNMDGQIQNVELDD
ncbi:hypothetical protein [Paenibacillus pini]|uniref:Lipoprotein n=1 Tax=Paenibacillus pini JCM 16418 TaxID=1236976 RepID=W7YJA1_9BACL|nr:hypothetical protein [Paenibacillus pini]GAF07683.1 hypothetical protein JCM16418_1711 [Paenibacillus pini JCM 16418]